jgi:Glycoside hydrolase family 2 C-terminal domain 5/Domain of unknown function (DUF4982)/Glycosyl hydrolases family 2, sugar binding domain/Glycosyl hydrolases family 2
MLMRKHPIRSPDHHQSQIGIWCLVFLWSLVLGVWSFYPYYSFAADSSPRQRLSFNSDWLFMKGDPAGSSTNLNYQTLKPWLLPIGADLTTNAQPAKPNGNPGANVTFAQSSFDDSRWRKLNLPPDWGIEDPFKQEYPGETGKLPWWGVGWYRKYFTLPADDKSKQIYLDVDGAMAYAAVWLNGQFVGGWPYGYSSWRLDLTPYVHFGGNNVIAIRLDNPRNSSRWYPGGGIYRNVWLVKCAPVGVGHWGTFITTPEITKDSASVNVRVDVDNHSGAEANIKLAAEIFELDSKDRTSPGPVASTESAILRMAPHSTVPAILSATVSKPKLWDVKNPARYLAITTVTQGGKVIDEKARMAKELEEIGKIRVPSRSSYFGIIDLAGFKKDRFYIYQARWRPELPMAHILPHWNWPERVGQVTPVHVYTSGDEAELFLNGKSLGKKKKGEYEYRLHWDDVSYQPGELKVIAFKNGKKWATDSMKTAGPAAKLVLSADHSTINADGHDLSYVTLTIADKSDLLVPRTKNRISFSISGPAEIIAADNGNPIDLESFQSKERNAFNGLAVAIVRSTRQAGTIVVKAASPGFASAKAKIASKSQ